MPLTSYTSGAPDRPCQGQVTLGDFLLPLSSCEGQKGLGCPLAERLNLRREQALYLSYRLRMPGDELTSQRGGSPTTLVHTIPGRMGMPSLPSALCSRLQALGPRRVTGTV